jgi:hypothetical protein
VKFIRPGDNAAAQKSYSGRPPAIRAAIERSKTKCIKLECGHYTDWDIDLAYSVFKPLGSITHYCEKCAEWIRKAEVIIIPLPDEPLF